jgi:hypothetical protein
MIPAAKRGHVLLTTVLVAAASHFGASRSEAQFGLGMGLGGGGFGFYGFGNTVQQPADFMNQVALAQMNHIRGPIHNNVYAGDPNAYFNRVRDNGFVDRYYPDRREPSYYGYASRPRAQRTTPTAATTAPARPVVPLKTFFNDKNQLVWPGDAPLGGDLKEKRDAVDKACLAVLDESKGNAVASIASVTEARQKLLDYGRPALADVRAKDTPRVADSFHLFLLSLYDSLAQAANPTAGS